jgi:hypothetical protein
MLRWIVRSSLRFRFLVVAAAGVLMLLGTSQLFGTGNVYPGGGIADHRPAGEFAQQHAAS